MSILSIILGFILKTDILENQMAVQTQLNFIIGIFYIVVFMWVIGIPFLIIMSAKGISLIANEFQEGTMGLLVSTKISRIKIVFYKWLALYFATVLLGTLAIIENISILYFITDMSEVFYTPLINSIPNLWLYLLFIGFVFSTIAILISLVIKSKVFATVTMITIIILIYLIIPLFKTFLMSYYEDYYLYYFDLNYHFSMIYYYFISKGNVELAPSIQMIMGTFIGIFDVTTITDPDLGVTSGELLLSRAPILKYITVKNLLIIWGLFGGFSLLFSMLILRKRDIS